jgi:hypothetical protein
MRYDKLLLKKIINNKKRLNNVLKDIKF